MCNIHWHPFISMPFNVGYPKTYMVIVGPPYSLCYQIGIIMDYFWTCILMNFLILSLIINGIISGSLH